MPVSRTSKDTPPTLGRTHTHVDGALRCELERIAEEVRQDLAEPERIPADHPRDVFVKLEMNRRRRVLTRLLEQRDGILQKAREVEGARLQRHLLRF